MSDFIEMGSIVPLEGGWYLDKETNTKFRTDKDGNVVLEDGTVLMDDDEAYDEQDG